MVSSRCPPCLQGVSVAILPEDLRTMVLRMHTAYVRARPSLRRNPRLANQSLHGQQRAVAHVRIWVRHELHHARLRAEVVDEPAR